MEIKRLFQDLRLNITKKRLFRDVIDLEITAGDMKLYATEKSFHSDLELLCKQITSEDVNQREMAQEKLTGMNPKRRAVLLAVIASLASKTDR